MKRDKEKNRVMQELKRLFKSMDFICDRYIKMGKSDKRGKKEYCGFPWELRKKDLKNFPVIFDFDENHRFLGLTILK